MYNYSIILCIYLFTGYLTIGIPTIKRVRVSYLDMTLESLIKNTIEEERREIVIAVYLADPNKTWIEHTSKELASRYRNHTRSGFLQIFHYHEQIYPDYQNLPRTFNDSYERVAWRSKQNIDYAFMFMYCKNISYYYMQLEDDVTAESRYFARMKFFISNINLQKSKWFSLEFSSLGFLGKLLRNNDLQDFANFLLMFYWEQPGDLLFGYMKKIKTQFRDILYKPPLFQHKGIISSLGGKRQYLQEYSPWKHSYSRKRFYNLNPEAHVETNIQVFEDHSPEKAYDMSDDYFWGISPKEGDFFMIKFRNPVNITRIYIEFGLPQRSNDILEAGVIEVSSAAKCENWNVIGKIFKHQFDTNITNTKLPNNIQCVMINVTKSQSNWIVIRELSIFRLGDVIIENPSYKEGSFQNNAEEFIKRLRFNPIYAKQYAQMIQNNRANPNFNRFQQPFIPEMRKNLQPNFFQDQFLKRQHDVNPKSPDEFRKRIHRNMGIKQNIPPKKIVYKKRMNG